MKHFELNEEQKIAIPAGAITGAIVGGVTAVIGYAIGHKLGFNNGYTMAGIDFMSAWRKNADTVVRYLDGGVKVFIKEGLEQTLEDNAEDALEMMENAMRNA